MMHAAIDALDLQGRVAAAARGDRGAYERLVHDHRRLVATISLAIVGEVAASEDVAQEVFVAAWRGLPRLKNPASFLPWLRQMTRNRAHKLLEARGRRRELRASEEATDALLASAVDPTPRTDARLVSAEEEAALHEALAALPDESREILTLFYREGQSVRQVADLLGLAEDAAKKRLSRARAKLRDDVLARFGEAAERTAPGEAFSSAVIAALPAGSAAGTALAAKLASGFGALGKVLAAFSGAILGGGGAAVGVWFGVRAAMTRARDESERRALFRLGIAQMGSTVVVAATYPFLHGWAALAEGLVFIALVNGMALGVAPRITARRRAAEREEDPGAAERERTEARKRGISIALGSGMALAAFVYNFVKG
jgi:RNA polymerase sigma factor (sigma-70 family)